MLQREKTHQNINPKSKSPPALATHQHRNLENIEARRRHNGRGNQCHVPGPDESSPEKNTVPYLGIAFLTGNACDTPGRNSYSTKNTNNPSASWEEDNGVQRAPLDFPGGVPAGLAKDGC
jgi:hypothetical protein